MYFTVTEILLANEYCSGYTKDFVIYRFVKSRFHCTLVRLGVLYTYQI